MIEFVDDDGVLAPNWFDPPFFCAFNCRCIQSEISVCFSSREKEKKYMFESLHGAKRARVWVRAQKERRSASAAWGRQRVDGV